MAHFAAHLEFAHAACNATADGPLSTLCFSSTGGDRGVEKSLLTYEIGVRLDMHIVCCIRPFSASSGPRRRSVSAVAGQTRDRPGGGKVRLLYVSAYLADTRRGFPTLYGVGSELNLISL